MLRTNSKKALANLDNYLMTEKEFLIWDYGIVEESANNVDICKAIEHLFEEEQLKYNERWLAHITTRFEEFEDWARGLALHIFDFVYYGQPTAKDIVKGLLEETEEEANKYTEEQAENLLIRMIYNRVSKLAK